MRAPGEVIAAGAKVGEPDPIITGAAAAADWRGVKNWAEGVVEGMAERKKKGSQLSFWWRT